MTAQKFEVGDIVSFGGVRLVVMEVEQDGLYCSRNKREDGRDWIWFNNEGYPESWMPILLPELTLNLVERPKKKVTKTIERWVNVYPGGNECTHHTEQSAEETPHTNRIACVKLTGTYEVYE